MHKMENIIEFVQSHPRNRLVITKNDIAGVAFMDVGDILSRKLQDSLEEKNLSFIATAKLDEIINLNMQAHKEIGSYIAIKNLGVLLEKQLRFDFKFLLEKYSRGTTLIIKWDGEIENGILYFLTKEKGKEISLNGISHRIV